MVTRREGRSRGVELEMRKGFAMVGDGLVVFVAVAREANV